MYHPVIVRDPAYLSLLLKTNGFRRTPPGTATSVFYLKKHKIILIISDDIDFTLSAPKIALPDPDSLFCKILTGAHFLFRSDFSSVQSASLSFLFVNGIYHHSFRLSEKFLFHFYQLVLANFALILSMESTKTRISATTS